MVGRTDALFGWIYQRFSESSLKKASFVECLEPYILSGELTRLTPDVVKDFVDHYEKKEALGIVEACIVNLDVANIDVQQVNYIILQTAVHTHSVVCHVQVLGIHPSTL